MMMLVLVVLLVALMIPLTAVILDSQVGRALAARLERDRLGGGDSQNRRLTALEAEVERLSTEVERLDEESTFLHRLLDAKPARESLPPGDEG